MPNKLNKEEFDQGLTLQDLRVIIHALKMQGLSAAVDPIAEDSIKSRIADLPSAETLLKMAEEPLKIKAVVKEVGEIMHLIESYPKSNTEYRDRHQVLTGLPPRYKVLEWRKNMNKADSVKTLVKLSENLDNKGQGGLSRKIITCAKKVRDEEKDEKYFNEVEKDLIQAGFSDEAKLMKEAINPALDPRNWFNKERREKQQTIWQGDKAQQERERQNLTAPAGVGNVGDPNKKEFDKRKEDAVGKLLNLHRENLSIIKQIETLNTRIKDFNDTYEVTGLKMQDVENSINTTYKYLKDLSDVVGETVKKMKGEKEKEFDYSPLSGQPAAPAAAAPVAAAPAAAAPAAAAPAAAAPAAAAPAAAAPAAAPAAGAGAAGVAPGKGKKQKETITEKKEELERIGYTPEQIAQMTPWQVKNIIENKNASRKTNIKLAKISLRK